MTFVTEHTKYLYKLSAREEGDDNDEDDDNEDDEDIEELLEDTHRKKSQKNFAFYTCLPLAWF